MIFVLAIVGLSGVGKSTLIAELERTHAIRHFTASDLIKSELAFRKSQVATSEELRLGPVVDNQLLLAAAFARHTQGVEGLVLLDAHVVSDGASGLIDIPASVFEELLFGTSSLSKPILGKSPNGGRGTWAAIGRCKPPRRLENIRTVRCRRRGL